MSRAMLQMVIESKWFNAMQNDELMNRKSMNEGAG